MRIRSAILVSSWIPGLFAQAVLTRSYNDLRTGANTQETHLTPANVGSLKVLRELTPDAGDDVRIEAQPLYVPQLAMADGPHDTAIVCTMANNVYAFDVNTGAKLWKTNLGTPIKPIVQGQTANGQQQTDIDSWGINHLWGILSTPVIDIDTKTLYVVSWSSSGGARNTAVHKLNALNLVTGQAAHPALTIKGQAAPAARFNSPDQKQRAALLLAPLTGGSKKTLYMGCGMTSETATADHGWLMAFDVGTFTQTSAWCTTPKSHGGGIWGAGAGPAADAAGNVYAMTANGGWNGSTDFAESFVRLQNTGGKLNAVDWFTPFLDGNRPKQAANGYDFQDQDLGSAAPVLPDGTNLLVGAGKDGVIYIFNRDSLGKKLVDQAKPALADNKPLLNAVFFTYFPLSFAVPPLVSLNSFPDGFTHHLHGSPLAWSSATHGTMLFVWGENAALRAWTLTPAGQMTFLGESQETASAFSTVYDSMPGGMITLSANGGQDGIVWGSVPIKGNWQGHDNNGNANQEIVEGVLRAYDASTFQGTDSQGNPQMKLLWQSTAPGHSQPGDTRFTYDKFCPPVVADGRVLLATYDGKVIVYGH
jgi:outer membrane protein assembly factor BamB